MQDLDDGQLSMVFQNESKVYDLQKRQEACWWQTGTRRSPTMLGQSWNWGCLNQVIGLHWKVQWRLHHLQLLLQIQYCKEGVCHPDLGPIKCKKDHTSVEQITYQSSWILFHLLAYLQSTDGICCGQYGTKGCREIKLD